jgi:hypothetical protein
MKTIIVCGSNSPAAVAALLMAAIQEAGVHIVDKPIELKCHETYDYDYNLFKPEPTHRPQIKRGKRKVKRW